MVVTLLADYNNVFDYRALSGSSSCRSRTGFENVLDPARLHLVYNLVEHSLVAHMSVARECRDHSGSHPHAPGIMMVWSTLW